MKARPLIPACLALCIAVASGCQPDDAAQAPVVIGHLETRDMTITVLVRGDRSVPPQAAASQEGRTTDVAHADGSRSRASIRETGPVYVPTAGAESALRFTVSRKDGTVVARSVTLQELKRSHPDVHEFLRTAIAKDRPKGGFVDAGLRTHEARDVPGGTRLDPAR